MGKSGTLYLVIVLLGNVLGHPSLVIFLLYSGLTILRKESRSLGNALALLAGIGLLFLPAFIVAWFLYQRRRIRTEPEAFIVLGSGLINGKVPPLLAARLKRGVAVHEKFGSRPTIITSGGQGADEPRPEGEAMRDYPIDNGVDPSRVVP